MIKCICSKKKEEEKLIYLNFTFTFGNHFKNRPGGEIGRRTAFRWQRSQGCAGSNPVPGTLNKALIVLTFKVFLFLCSKATNPANSYYILKGNFPFKFLFSVLFFSINKSFFKFGD